MKLKRQRFLGFLSAALLLAATVPSHAEFAGEYLDGGFSLVVLAIIEDPDPVPALAWAPWEPIRVGISGDTLNLEGHPREDGPPENAYDPVTGQPLVTWAYRAGSDYDIAVSDYSGEGWTEPVFLTVSSMNDLDPHTYIDDAGRAYVVWWRPGEAPRLYLAVREPGSTEWSLPQMIASPGRRPSLVRVGEDLLVAYERDHAAGGQELVLATLPECGGITYQVVTTTERTDPLRAVVHHAGGELWVDWQASDGSFAYSVRADQGWTEPVELPLYENSWLAEEEVRKVIRSDLLVP
jgi:hypothetical protein